MFRTIAATGTRQQRRYRRSTHQDRAMQDDRANSHVASSFSSSHDDPHMLLLLHRWIALAGDAVGCDPNPSGTSGEVPLVNVRFYLGSSFVGVAISQDG